jgi:anaerobic magnesium-protoporphyrin IX monomethyl ester cyclase
MGSHYNGLNLGLSYIASVLRKNGFFASIYNADYLNNNRYLNQKEIFMGYDNYKSILNDKKNLLWNEISKKITKFNPDILGITMFTANYKVSKMIASNAKKFNDKMIVVVGGVHPTIDAENTLRNDEFDFLVRGEGEYTFLDLISGKEFSKIKGLSYKQKDKIIHNEKRPFIKNLDLLPFPERNFFITSTKHMDFGSVITGRGCPYNCIFCASSKIWERKVRFRSAENVLEELKHLKKNFNSNLIYFVDDTFTLDKSRAKKICQGIIDKKLNLKWKCDTRVDALDYELVSLMKKSGCIRIKIGVETGSERMQKRIKKNLTKAKIRKGIKIIKKVDLPLTIYLMAGFPGETDKDIKETIKFAEEIDADYYSLSIVSPYLGTEIYDEFIKSGGNPSKEHWEYFYHQSKYMILNNKINQRLVNKFLALNDRPGKGIRV